MPSADQVPTKLSHSTMLWHEWVVLIAGSTGSALRAVRPPNLHITPVVRRDFVYRASATGSLYRSPLAIMAQTIRAILLASAIAATFVGRRASKAVGLFGVDTFNRRYECCDHCNRQDDGKDCHSGTVAFPVVVHEQASCA